MDTGITRRSSQHHISGPGLGIFKFQQILSIIYQADSIVVVFYNNLAVGHPSVKYFPRVFELASPVGKICTSFGQIIVDVNFHRFSVVELEGIVLKVGSFLHHPAFNTPACKFDNDRRGLGGDSAESLSGLGAAGGRPTRWVTSKFSRPIGGSMLMFLLNSDRIFESVFPGVSSGIPNTLIEAFLPCSSKSSWWISRSETFLARAEIVASFSAICDFSWEISAFADLSATSSGLNKGAIISWYFFIMESSERDSRKFNLKVSILKLVSGLSAIFGQEFEDLNLFFQVDMTSRTIYNVTAVFSGTGWYSKNRFKGTEAAWLTYCAVQCSLGALSTY